MYDTLQFAAAPDAPPEELLRRLAALSKLVEITRRMAGAVNLDDTLRIIAGEVCQALDCERSTLFQYDRKTDTLVSRAATELEIPEIRKRLGEGIVGATAVERVPTIVADPMLDPRWDRSVDARTGFRTRNILAAPILAPHSNALLGVLQLINKREAPFDRFDLDLVEVFCRHAAAALERAQLIEEIRSQHAMRASLEVARQVQRTFMPSRLPAIPGYDIATWWFPNEAIGGDYCDIVPFRDGRWGIVIADVSGHGLGPSLLMASVRAGLRALLLEHSSPELLLGRIGAAMCGDLQDGKFITMYLGALDPVAHAVQYANAGHGPCLKYSAARREFVHLEASGLPLGILEEPEYPQLPLVRLDVGDLIVLCTDGIVEAINEFDEQFGLERLQEAVRRLAERPMDELVKEIGRQVSVHYVGDSPPDDLTIVALRRRT